MTGLLNLGIETIALILVRAYTLAWRPTEKSIMPMHHFQFIIPTSMSIHHMISKLRKSNKLSEEPTTTATRIYYDTFDWRLNAKHLALEAQSKNGDSMLYLNQLESDEILASQRVGHTPQYAWDLPPTTLRKLLEPIIEMRALIPQTTIITRTHPLKGMDKRDKTTVRVVIEDNSVVHTELKTRLGKIIKVVPIKGYSTSAERIAQEIGTELELAPVAGSLLLMALEACGRQPGTYTPKLNVDLNPELRADEATRFILRRLLTTMQDNEEGTREAIDSEFLHDFRVAVRRTRSALSQIKDVFPEAPLERFKKEFAWLGQITGPTRDLDVYLLKFNDYQNSLPESMRGDLDALRDFLQKHQQAEQQTLAKALGSPRYKRLVKAWRKFLETALPSRSTQPNATRPILSVAKERTWRVYRRALKEGRAIKPQTPAESLHELRKTCKKLRYLMEFFQSLYPPAEIKALIKVLKTLQDNLGEFQDYEVQITTLKNFSEQMLSDGRAPAGTLMAMGILVENLAIQQRQVRECFATRFDEFGSQDHQQHFKALFHG